MVAFTSEAWSLSSKTLPVISVCACKWVKQVRKENIKSDIDSLFIKLAVEIHKLTTLLKYHNCVTIHFFSKSLAFFNISKFASIITDENYNW